MIAPDNIEATLARYRASSDPRLLELLDNARRAFDELAAYMVQQCAAAGVELPTEWRTLTNPDRP
jgi:hypothetical protein